MIRRLALRTILFFALTVLAFFALESLVYLGRAQVSDINERFPEIMRVMLAVGIQSWIEISIMWFRVLISPRLDVQDIACNALRTSQGAAIIFFALQLAWSIRLLSVLFLYWIQGAPA